MKLTQAEIDRFRSYIIPTKTCWIWDAARQKQGYGNFNTKYGFLRAHRISYFLWNGPIPRGHLIRHKCDMPWCVNPAHLESGTNLDNIKDVHSRGRYKPNRKLSENQVIKILKLSKSGVSDLKIAKLYNVSRGCISGITWGDNWKKLKSSFS
jgi:hypothetical protein